MKRLFTFLLVTAMPLLALAQQRYYVGGDISTLQLYEDFKVAYYDQQGSKIDDVMKYLKSETVGWNALRVRLFVNPTKAHANGDSDPQVCQDLDYVVRLGKRIKAEGFAFMLDFHYSDTWADPSNQWTPAAWTSLTDDQLQQKVYTYTKECLQRLVDESAAPDFIQIGNEISYGMLWGKYPTKTYYCTTSSPATTWTRFTNLLSQASKACREVCPRAQIIIHTERAGKPSTLTEIHRRLNSVDYDVIGLSYYPFWHNGLNVLSQSLKLLEANFPTKMVQIVETAYYYQWQPAVGNGIDYDYSSTWPITPAGQAAFAKDLITELQKHANVNGLYWWFPEENGNGPNSQVLKGWVNRGLWDDNTHRALPGLYVLKDFLPEGSGISAPHADARADGRWYNLHGVGLDSRPSHPGIYILDGRKMTIR